MYWKYIEIYVNHGGKTSIHIRKKYWRRYISFMYWNNSGIKWRHFSNNLIVKNNLERHNSRENMLIDFIYGLFSDADFEVKFILNEICSWDLLEHVASF